MVLCITHSADFYTIDIVQHALQQAGVPSFRLNTDEFAINYRLEYNSSPANESACIVTGNQNICANNITGVWYRKQWKMKVPAELDPAYHQTFTKEYQTYLRIFFNQLRHVPWMNKIDSDHVVGSDKLMQLSAANAAGLTTPKSIFTNNAETIRGFFETCKGNLIVKLHGSLSKSMDGNAAFFPTTKLQAKDLDRLNELAYCPMIFQEYIPKEYELRIIYVDGDFFTGKIPYEGNEATDWRAIRDRQNVWQHYELPEHVCKKLTVMMHALDLTFGAIDMIRNKEGDYVFLEVNPQGEWGMIQKYLDLPIGETIAQKLITSIKNG
jgi:glutathione synthase/RimK-type ligase-like ATP-grasp enzyme